MEIIDTFGLAEFDVSSGMFICPRMNDDVGPVYEHMEAIADIMSELATIYSMDFSDSLSVSNNLSCLSSSQPASRALSESFCHMEFKTPPSGFSLPPYFHC